MTYIEDFEVGGLEEIILGLPSRTHTLQVESETSFLLFMSTKQFKENIINPMPSVKHAICQHL